MSEEKSRDGQGSEHVGYRHPPKSGQFKKGHSGNPNGRPKGTKSLQKVLETSLNRKVTVRDGAGAKKIPAIEALMLKQFEMALKGNQKSAELILKYAAMVSAGGESGSTDSGDGTAPDAEQDLRDLKLFAKLLEADFDPDQLNEGAEGTQ